MAVWFIIGYAIVIIFLFTCNTENTIFLKDLIDISKSSDTKDFIKRICAGVGVVLILTALWPLMVFPIIDVILKHKESSW
ncbi:MAG: hypothetical protein H8E12_06190 [Rhodobacteraceae bacterium]|nr:hypothetical protein [Paracoccaceae bacterium]